MNKYLYGLVCGMLCTLMATSCNDEIFIKGSDLPSETSISLSGCGGEWSGAYSREGLKHIFFDYASGYKEYLRYDDVNGNVTDASCQPSELSAIVYSNPMRYYSVGFSGDMIYICCNYNAASADAFTLRLVYDSGVTKLINVSVSEGPAMEKTYWKSTGALSQKDKVESVTHSTSMANNGPVAQKMRVYPYSEARVVHWASPGHLWARGMTLTMPLLTFFRGEWCFEEFDDVEMGAPKSFSHESFSYEYFEVDVPPFSKAIVKYTLSYSLAEMSGVVQFLNPISEYSADVDVVWKSVYPTSYEYTVEYE